MGRSALGRQRRVAKLEARISSSDLDHFPKCTIIGCGQPTLRAAKTGLSVALCRKHLQHRQRHGSPFCPSPPAPILKPYLEAALKFIHANRDDPFIKSALLGLDGLMESAGSAVIATRLRGLPPAERARVAVARLRDANIKPERLLTIAVAVHALIENDPAVTHRIPEWRIVAIAKAAHRLSSGYHRVWETTDAEGRTRRTELHAWPRSAGGVLRHLGAMIEKEAELVIDRHLQAIVALKVKHSEAHSVTASHIPSEDFA